MDDGCAADAEGGGAVVAVDRQQRMICMNFGIALTMGQPAPIRRQPLQRIVAT